MRVVETSPSARVLTVVSFDPWNLTPETSAATGLDTAATDSDASGDVALTTQVCHVKPERAAHTHTHSLSLTHTHTHTHTHSLSLSLSHTHTHTLSLSLCLSLSLSHAHTHRIRPSTNRGHTKSASLRAVNAFSLRAAGRATRQSSDTSAAAELRPVHTTSPWRPPPSPGISRMRATPGIQGRRRTHRLLKTTQKTSPKRVASFRNFFAFSREFFSEFIPGSQITLDIPLTQMRIPCASPTHRAPSAFEI